MKNAVYCALVVLFNGLSAHSRRVVLQDQVNGETGFVYRTDTNGPTSYVQYTTGHGIGGGTHLGYPPLTLGHVGLQTEPLASLYPVVEATLQYHGPPIQSLPSGGGGGDGDMHKNASGYSQGGGSESNSGHQTASGEKGEKGYKSANDYSKESEGKHNEEGHKGHYNQTGGSEKSNHDSAENYNKDHSSGNSHKGGSFSDETSHKKGSKTTGYHKVYRKDEYKKDHTYYDESNSSGHFDKYGRNHSEHSGEEGDHKKGGQSASGFSKGDRGKSGYFDKEVYSNQDNGDVGAEGHDKYYANTSDYSNNEEESGGKKNGYSDDYETN